jgi:hypothetical protein
MVLGKLVIYIKKTETQSLFSPCTKINSKWAEDFNRRLQTATGKHRENSGKYRHR